jgi:hypothetical protein
LLIIVYPIYIRGYILYIGLLIVKEEVLRLNTDELRRRKDKGPYYELNLDDKRQIYDKMPYVRDINLCNRESIRYVSGNIVKLYQYNVAHIKVITN